MNRQFTGWLLAALTLAGGCATTMPTPTGPSVTIADSAQGDVSNEVGYGFEPGKNVSGAPFFYLAEVDGLAVGETNLSKSRSRSHLQGRQVFIVPHERRVAAGTHRLKLVGEHVLGAPIQYVFSAKGGYRAEGIIEADLRPDVRYRVNGHLDSFRREVWLEEDGTGRIVGTKIVGVASTAASTPGPNVTPDRVGSLPVEPSQFTCCNLHYDDDWISDTNALTLPFVPAGTPITLTSWGRYRANVLIDGKPMRIGLDYGRKQQTKEDFVGKLMVGSDPKSRIATFPPETQAAIEAGKVAIGMTPEQVLISLGHPRMDMTPSLNAPEWTYFTEDEEQLIVLWSDGKVAEVDASARVRRRVMVAPLPPKAVKSQVVLTQ